MSINDSLNQKFKFVTNVGASVKNLTTADLRADETLFKSTTLLGDSIVSQATETSAHLESTQDVEPTLVAYSVDGGSATDISVLFKIVENSTDIAGQVLITDASDLQQWAGVARPPGGELGPNPGLAAGTGVTCTITYDKVYQAGNKPWTLPVVLSTAFPKVFVRNWFTAPSDPIFDPELTMLAMKSHMLPNPVVQSQASSFTLTNFLPPGVQSRLQSEFGFEYFVVGGYLYPPPPYNNQDN